MTRAYFERTFCCYSRHPSQADGDSGCVERLFDIAELIPLLMCVYPGRILADSAYSFEASAVKIVYTGGAIASTEAASCFQVRNTKLSQLQEAQAPSSYRTGSTMT